MNHYQELREALGIPQETSHEDALKIARSAECHIPDPCVNVQVPKELHGDAFVAAWNRWGRYRAERKLSKYKPTGLKAQLTRLAEMGAARAIAAINYSITQNYQGIYEERQGSAAQNTRATGTLNGPNRYNLGAGVHGGKRTQTPEGI